MNVKKISIGLLFLILALVIVPGTTTATPSYASKMGVSCGTCHVNPNGGGKLTAAGTYFLNSGHTQLPPVTTPPVTTPPIKTPSVKTPSVKTPRGHGEDNHGTDDNHVHHADAND